MERTNDQFRYIYMKRAGFLKKSPADVFYPRLKWADNVTELEDAFTLLHDEYLREGYLTKPSRSGIYFNVHNLLRNSATLVAKRLTETIGTLSVVMDDPQLGLPLDCLYTKEMKTLRRKGRKVCEFSALAVSNASRDGKLIMRLFRAMYWYAVSNKMDDICIVVNPKHVPFYKKILLFEDLGLEKTYPRLGAPAVCLRLNLNHSIERYAEAYHGFDCEYSLYEYFIVLGLKECKHLISDERRYYMNGASARYFLDKEQKIKTDLDPQDLFYILSQPTEENCGKWKSIVL